jgi:hypothetical protein
MSYLINEHKHRFAAWAASRAASTSKLCRFPVEVGKNLLADTNIMQHIDSPETLPDNFDEAHRQWRKIVITNAETKYDLKMTHGVAAKLINVYLKGLFICGGHHTNTKVMQIHPPIDSLLLEALAVSDVGGLKSKWKRFASKRWSNFTHHDYEELILLIKSVTPPKTGLWAIEEHWRGYQ